MAKSNAQHLLFYFGIYDGIARSDRMQNVYIFSQLQWKQIGSMLNIKFKNDHIQKLNEQNNGEFSRMVSFDRTFRATKEEQKENTYKNILKQELMEGKNP